MYGLHQYPNYSKNEPKTKLIRFQIIQHKNVDTSLYMMYDGKTTQVDLFT